MDQSRNYGVYSEEVLFITALYKQVRLEKAREFISFVNKKITENGLLPNVNVALSMGDNPGVVITQPGVDYSFVLNYGPDSYKSKWFAKNQGGSWQEVRGKIMSMPTVESIFDVFLNDATKFGFTNGVDRHA